MGLYALVGLLYLFLFARIVNRGPEHGTQGAVPGIGTGAAIAELQP